MQMDVKPNSGNLDKCVCTHCWLGQMFTWIKSASPRSTFHTLLLQHGIFFMATYENHQTYWQDDNIILLVGLACEQRSPEHCFLFIIQSIINQVATWLNQVCLCCTAGSWSGSPWAQIRRVWVISSSQPIVLVGCSHKQTHLHARLPQPPWRSSFPTAHKHTTIMLQAHFFVRPSDGQRGTAWCRFDCELTVWLPLWRMAIFTNSITCCFMLMLIFVSVTWLPLRPFKCQEAKHT